MSKPETDGVLYLSDPERFEEKTRAYLAVRSREGRVLTDEQLRRLPASENTHLRGEWRWRARTFRRFERYLQTRFKGRPLRILDLGCGNGWMALRLARQPQWEIWAADVNRPELEQGARVALAGGEKRPHFVFADVLENNLPEKTFDLVVLAASVQYFPDLPALAAALRRILKTGGEIHLLDSPFYPAPEKRRAAQNATRRYYAGLGVPEMAAWYHHHLWQDIAALGGENLNAGLVQKILQKLKWLPPFPWVRIKVREG